MVIDPHNYNKNGSLRFEPEMLLFFSTPHPYRLIIVAPAQVNIDLLAPLFLDIENPKGEDIFFSTIYKKCCHNFSTSNYYYRLIMEQAYWKLVNLSERIFQVFGIALKNEKAHVQREIQIILKVQFII